MFSIFNCQRSVRVKKGDIVLVKVVAHDPVEPNNCPLDMDNPSLAQIGIRQPLSKPVLDHIDLIGATITGNVPMTNEEDAVATDFQVVLRIAAVKDDILRRLVQHVFDQ